MNNYRIYNQTRWLYCVECPRYSILLEARFLYGVYRQGNNFELIQTVKMETKHAAEGFGSDFPAICNHCGVMAAGSLKMA